MSQNSNNTYRTGPGDGVKVTSMTENGVILATFGNGYIVYMDGSNVIEPRVFNDIEEAYNQFKATAESVVHFPQQEDMACGL